MGLPFTVFRGHYRTSTFLADTVRTLANISDRFRAGETYNIGGRHHHSIEDLAAAVLKVTGADPALVEYQDSEILTTKVKRVDISKSIRDLDHRNSYDLEAGLSITADWMRDVYRLAEPAGVSPSRRGETR
jgi:dTDP-glucose 4,6-dehydratase